MIGCMEAEGIEPSAPRLKVGRSTTDLRLQMDHRGPTGHVEGGAAKHPSPADMVSFYFFPLLIFSAEAMSSTFHNGSMAALTARESR